MTGFTVAAQRGLAGLTAPQPARPNSLPNLLAVDGQVSSRPFVSGVRRVVISPMDTRTIM
jgi:hypothetical protein